METSQQNFKADIYKNDFYIDKNRWISYFWQTKLIKDLVISGSILEVGVGNKVVSNYLKKTYQVATIDINKNLQPDYVGSVDNLNFLPDNKYDVVLCAEVLEHLPFDRFKTCLGELKRVAKKNIIISLPYWGYTFGFKLRMPYIGVKIVKFKISQIKKHKFNGEHYWEIGKRGYSLKKIKQIFKDEKLTISQSFWDLDDPYHYYFVLKK